MGAKGKVGGMVVVVVLQRVRGQSRIEKVDAPVEEGELQPQHSVSMSLGWDDI
jgi:hypothetical protein